MSPIAPLRVSPQDVQAIAVHASQCATADDWMNSLSNVERLILVSTACPHLKDIDAKQWTLLVRAVWDELRKPSVLLGTGTCSECQGELEDDGYCPNQCNHEAFYPDLPRAERPFSKRWAG